MLKKLSLIGREKFSYYCSKFQMMQAMLPKALRPMNFYFSTVYQEIWVGLALTTYAYYKISYGGKKGSGNKSSGSGHH